jgi:hypothetical protein
MEEQFYVIQAIALSFSALPTLILRKEKCRSSFGDDKTAQAQAQPCPADSILFRDILREVWAVGGLRASMT